MTDAEEAYNRGVSDASGCLRRLAKWLPATHAINGKSLLIVADTIDELKFPDPAPPDPVDPPSPDPAPISPAAAVAA